MRLYTIHFIPEPQNICILDLSQVLDSSPTMQTCLHILICTHGWLSCSVHFIRCGWTDRLASIIYPESL